MKNYILFSFFFRIGGYIINFCRCRWIVSVVDFIPYNLQVLLRWFLGDGNIWMSDDDYLPWKSRFYEGHK